MRVYYDAATGRPTFTMAAQIGFAGPEGDWIEVPDQPLDLHLWRVEDGALVALIDETLAEARQQALETVNRTSGDIRARFITVIPGQEMLYILKEREAIRWLAETAAHEKDEGPAPALEQFELIAAEVGITATNATSVAQVYVNMAAILRQTAAQLETLRLGTIATLEGASDTDAIDAALAQFLTAVAP